MHGEHEQAHTEYFKEESKQMTKKKLVAVATALALIVLPLQVALADGLGSQVITGDAAVDYVDPASVINLIVPTSSSLGFTLDPQNLAATQGVGAWDPSQGGSVIPAAVNILVNQSAVPIKATVHFTLQDPSSNSVVLVDKNSVNTGTAKNMYLSFVPAKSKTTVAKVQIAALAAPTFVQDSGDDAIFHGADLTAAGVASGDMLDDQADPATATFGQFIETGASTDDYNQVEVPAHGVIAATTQTTVSAYTATPGGMEDITSAAELADMTDGIDLAYALDKADYYVIKDTAGYTLTYDGAARNDNYDTASFVLSGLINKNADWSGYDSSNKITVTAAYSFEIMAQDAYDTAMAAKLGSSYNSISAVPAATVSGVTVTPATITVGMGATHTFTATVAGTNNPDQTVTWSLTGTSNAGTTIDASSGLLTVAADESATTLTVTATSTADGTKTGTSTVTVGAPTPTVSSVTVTPGTPSVAKGATQSFGATVAGTHSPAQTVTWSVSGKTSSSTAIDAAGLLTVGSDETATSLTVTATSTVDTGKSGTATVTVTAPLPVGFTDVGNTSTSTKTYTYSKATGTGLTMGFNFGGNSITSFLSYNGIAMATPADYTVTSNSVTITTAKLASANVGTRAYTFVVNGVTYTVNVTITA